MKTVHKDVYDESTNNDAAADNDVTSPENHDQDRTTVVDQTSHITNRGASSITADSLTANDQNDHRVDIHHAGTSFTEQYVGDTQFIMLQNAFSNV